MQILVKVHHSRKSSALIKRNKQICLDVCCYQFHIWSSPFIVVAHWHIVSWEPEGRYQYSKMFHWEPEVHAPSLYKVYGDSTLLVLNGTLAPFWLSTDDTERPRKNNPETIQCCEQVVGCMTIIISWSMINMLSNDTYIVEIPPVMLHLAGLFSKLNVKIYLFHFRYNVGRRIGNYNRSPMWLSLG